MKSRSLGDFIVITVDMNVILYLFGSLFMTLVADDSVCVWNKMVVHALWVEFRYKENDKPFNPLLSGNPKWGI